MDQLMALLVQVDSLAGDITGDEDADGCAGPTEGFHDLELFGVLQPAVHHRERRVKAASGPPEGCVVANASSRAAP